MIRYILFITCTLISTISSSQSISYAVGAGLPYSRESKFEISPLLKYKKGTETYISIGLNGTNSIADQAELRLSTYSTNVENSFNFSSNNTTTYNLRKYKIELQTYFYKINLRGFGAVDFGSRFSYLLRSDITGESILPNGQAEPIKSRDFDRESKFNVHVIGKYSPGTIKLDEFSKLKPAYIFSYSFSNDVNLSRLVNTRLISHMFELAFITDLGPKKK